MIQRVPDNWNFQQNEPFPEIQLDTNTISFNTTIPTRELQWIVGGAPPPPLGAHGNGGVRANGNPRPLPAVGGTLESVVNQAATNKRNLRKHVPWNRREQRAAAAPAPSSDTTSLQAMPAGGVDAMVPCNNARAGGGPGGSYVPSYGNCSATHAGSCSADAGKGYPRGSGTSMTVSATFETESHQLTVETSQLEMMSQGFTFTTNSLGGSLGNTSSAANETKTTDSASHSINERDGEDGKANRKGKSSQVSVKKNRAAAVHNQSERKRRDRINEKMRTLQRMVPNASKTDKASMLDEVIDYLKQLKAQVNIMTRMPSMLMQQQLQLISMMGLGMNMGMGITGAGGIMPPPNTTEVLPPFLNPFMSPSGWEGIIGHGSDVPLQTVPVGLEAPAPHPFNVFLARQQAEAPNAMEAAARMSALYQQFQQFQQLHGAV